MSRENSLCYILNMDYFEEAAKVARNAMCLKGLCGSIVVATDGMIIGRGYNAPPLEDETQRTCNKEWSLERKPKFDKTCCVHAEWNAILDACKSFPDKIVGSTLYFMRVDENGDFTNAGEPYCTVCSRLALQSGIEYFCLWNGQEVRYDTKTYNLKSYEYFAKSSYHE